VRKKRTATSKSNKKGLVFVVSGPSGSGKTTLVAKLVKDKDLRNAIIKSVSVTTRPRRLKEKPGEAYRFVSRGEFLQLRKTKKLLEWTRYLGYYYATPRDVVEEALRSGRGILLSLDLKGAARIRQLYPRHSVTVFILPPSMGALRERIEKRSPEAKDGEIHRRLQLAEKEILAADTYDYCLVNRDLPKTISRLKKIVLREIGS